MGMGRTACYLLSVQELEREKLGEAAWQHALELLDAERLEKVQRYKGLRQQAQALGAGLLLQCGVREWQSDWGRAEAGSHARPVGAGRLRILTLQDILERVVSAYSLCYTYGARGKPYFADPLPYFNLSHSGDYVLCGMADWELGVDIQQKRPAEQKRPAVQARLVERFFSEREKELWKLCGSKEEQEELFYRLWTRKEAYGKLTGEGIAAVTGTDVSGAMPYLAWEEYEAPAGYCVAVCHKLIPAGNGPGMRHAGA